MFSCIFCSKELKNNRSLAAHKRHCISNPDRIKSNARLHIDKHGPWNKGKRLVEPKYSNCIICDKQFEVKKKSHITCSHACSNKHFRTGLERDDNTYRTICFRNHEKKCVACDEVNIVEVHHYDENHSNNDPSNLVPLCPTHHKYWHSRFKHLIEESVHSYVKEYRKKELSC